MNYIIQNYFKLKLTLASVMLALSLVAMAEKPDLKFKRIDTRNGLSNSQVNCILKDSKGFVWIGTKFGLNRYDGYRFLEFHSHVKDSTALISDYVDNLYEDIDGNIWVQQETRFCIYNQKEEAFTQNLSPWLEKVGASGGVERMYIDKAKNYWIKVWDGKLYYYNPRKNIKNSFDVANGKYGVGVGVNSFASRGRSTVVMMNNGTIVSLDGDKGKSGMGQQLRQGQTEGNGH